MVIVTGIAKAKPFASFLAAEVEGLRKSAVNLILKPHCVDNVWYLRVAGYQTQFMG